ncbi:hypothetical protein ACFLZV_01260 [Candidatus Margulisiibacteriota bacterium]
MLYKLLGCDQDAQGGRGMKFIDKITTFRDAVYFRCLKKIKEYLTPEIHNDQHEIFCAIKSVIKADDYLIVRELLKHYSDSSNNHLLMQLAVEELALNSIKELKSKLENDVPTINMMVNFIEQEKEKKEYFKIFEELLSWRGIREKNKQKVERWLDKSAFSKFDAGNVIGLRPYLGKGNSGITDAGKESKKQPVSGSDDSGSEFSDVTEGEYEEDSNGGNNHHSGSFKGKKKNRCCNIV